MPEGVFGGRVTAITQADDGVSDTRVYIATESANSIFYADVSYVGGRPVLDSVQPLPSADWDDGYGSGISAIHAFSSTKELFFLANGSIYKTDPSASSASMELGMVKAFTIHSNVLLAVLNGATPTSNDSLVWGTISTTGNLSISGGLGLTRKFNQPPKLSIDPTSNYLFLFESGTSPYLLVVNESVLSLTSSSSITSALNPAPSDPNIEWTTFGVAPNGNWYIAGGPAVGAPPSTDRKIGMTADNGVTWLSADFALPGPPGGVPGSNFQFTAVGALQFGVYCGRAFSDSIGAPGTWVEIGHAFQANNNAANDGAVLLDSRNQSTAYVTTNVGFGLSRWEADSIYGANNGLTAVQVNDIDMTESFSTGFVASKSGIRKVEAYKSGSPMWSDPIFPQGDGSPYFSVAMDPSDSNTVYVGNGRVYKTTNGGANWTLVFDPMMGGTHGAIYNFPRVGTVVTGLAVSSIDPNTVYATYQLSNGDDGGIFVSVDGGANWTQELITAAAPGMDVNALDVEMIEEAGKSVFYVALASDPMTTGYYGVYRIEESGAGTRTATAESAFGATDAILDLDVSRGSDTLYALYHTSSTINPPTRVYVKDIATSAWSFIIGPSGTTPSALTSGGGNVFIAVENEIYHHPVGTISGPWTLSYTYPVGTQINSMFWDELLVGTGTGLYAQFMYGIGLNEEDLPIYSVYPNPTSTRLTWEISDHVVLIDLFGRTIIESNNASSMDVQYLPKGVYLLIGEKIGTHKVVIE